MAGTVRVASLLLAAIFAWASAAKVLGWSRWRGSLRRYRLGPAGAAAQVGVPLAEATIAALLVANNVRLGAAGALALVAAFSFAVLRARSFEGDRLPCGCFGGAGERDFRVMLLRNSLLALLAGLALALDLAISARPQAPSAREALPAALVAAGAVTIVWLGRQVTSSLRRR